MWGDLLEHTHFAISIKGIMFEIEKREVKKRSFNAQIEFTMHEMKCFMILCEKLMTAEKRRGWRRRRKALKTQYEAKKKRLNL